jgi:hypothetical protein
MVQIKDEFRHVSLPGLNVLTGTLQFCPSRPAPIGKLVTGRTPSFSTKNIRCQLHGDAELTIARLDPHHVRLAVEGLVFEI